MNAALKDTKLGYGGGVLRVAERAALGLHPSREDHAGFAREVLRDGIVRFGRSACGRWQTIELALESVYSGCLFRAARATEKSRGWLVKNGFVFDAGADEWRKRVPPHRFDAPRETGGDSTAARQHGPTGGDL